MSSPEAGEFDAAGFVPGYRVRINPEFPPDGVWPCPTVAFDREGLVRPEFTARWGTPVVVGVEPFSGPEWVGMFPAGGLGGVYGVYATPSPRHLCVVVAGTAYLVDCLAPEQGADVAYDAVRQVAQGTEPPLLLLITNIDILAVGASGVAWRSPRLAVDGLRVVAVDSVGGCVNSKWPH